MSRRRIAVAALLFLISCDNPAAPHARALRAPGLNADVVRTKGSVVFSTDGSLDNTCNGDVVTLVGKVHQVFTEIDSGDSIYISLHTNFADVKGYGVPSGARYHVNNAESEKVIVTEGSLPFTFNDVIHMSLELVSEGSEPNLIWDLTEITRIDDNGETVTVTDLKNSLRCRG
jgi:hypothetical protein